MSEEWRAKRAKQAKIRRAKQKKRLEILKQQANADRASLELKNEYLVALKKRKVVLDGNKERVKKQRDKLKNNPQRADKAKKKWQLYYRKRLVEGKEKTWKATQRSRNRLKMIKKELESDRDAVNSQCMKFKRCKMTPLGAAIKYCDLDAVKYVLEQKASPTQRYSSTRTPTPLYEAAWMGKSKIAHLLIEKNAILEGGLTHGALHGAIQNRMFQTIKMMLDHGCDVNETYLGQTPLGAALTCGKSKLGDVRLVRRLLEAKADMMKKTIMCDSPFLKAPKGYHMDLATTYSNKKCQALLKTQEKDAR